MNKWGKIAQFATFFSTFIVLGVILYSNLNGGASSANKEEMAALSDTQEKHSEALHTFKEEVDSKIETQNNVLLEYNNRMTDIESHQTEFLTIVDTMDKEIQQVKQNQQQQGTTAPTTPTQPTQPQQPTNQLPSSVTVAIPEGLHLRVANSTGSESKGLLAHGTKLTVLDGPSQKDGFNWYKVQTESGTVGWVAKEFVQ